MAREGLMDDTGWHGFDEAIEFFDNFCEKCKLNNPYTGECRKHGIFTCDGEDFEEDIYEK